MAEIARLGPTLQLHHCITRLDCVLLHVTDPAITLCTVLSPGNTNTCAAKVAYSVWNIWENVRQLAVSVLSVLAGNPPSPSYLVTHICTSLNTKQQQQVQIVLLVCVVQVSAEVVLTRSDEDELKVKALEYAAAAGQKVWVKVRAPRLLPN